MPIRLVFKHKQICQPWKITYPKATGHLFLIEFLCLCLKVRLPKENISALNYIIWLLVSYIRFPSVINSSVQKGRTFSPQVSRANDIINFLILGDSDFQLMVRLSKLMVLFNSTEQLGRRSKRCNDWEKSLYPLNSRKIMSSMDFFFFLLAYFIVPLLKNFNTTLEWRWFTIILRPPNSQWSITNIQLRLSDSDVNELDVLDIWSRQTSYLSSSFHRNKSTWLFWPTVSF